MKNVHAALYILFISVAGARKIDAEVQSAQTFMQRRIRGVHE